MNSRDNIIEGEAATPGNGWLFRQRERACPARCGRLLSSRWRTIARFASPKVARLEIARDARGCSAIDWLLPERLAITRS
jgi:hypothetical protein